MLWIEGFVVSILPWTICEFCDPPSHERVHIERNRPHRNRFVAAWNLYQNWLLNCSWSLTYLCPVWKTSTQAQKAVLQAVRIATGLRRTHRREKRTMHALSDVRLTDSRSTNRISEKNFREVLPDRVHCGLNGRFKEPRRFFPVCAAV